MSMTLIDSFGRLHTYLRISVTDRCNLRCRYCMPSEGLQWKKREELLSFEEIERLAAIFVGMGVTKIRLTGGEPMLRRDFPELVAKLAGLKASGLNTTGLKDLAMTTNATLLAGQAALLKEKGLSHINISLDSFKPERFEQITRLSCFDAVKAGLHEAIAAGFSKLKLNMVVIAGFNDDEILDFAAFAREHKINVRFIEFMPFKDNDWQIDKVVTFKEMKASLDKHFKLSPAKQEVGDVARDFDLAGGGSLSFITSMSESFCSSCNRLRLTSDGSMKSCLFYPAEINLRDAMRQNASDEELRGMIRGCLAGKPEAHPPAEEIAARDNRSMIEIGG
ncbi:MAG: GTP 3',8-cyclase MoaA [Candidatus Obscuribacter phosphatis]|uniref:GTP 3',8-cyclase n=1 Tax=Candidatus Obscuribacter phosphatis TaxID=1906157 RepID=A0A8J7PAC3_9BACT|nr:GTP 3',8-cyclase MoaA [Candidatus Obscuribacter phosphatis]